MRYKDTKTGEVFENLSDMAWRMCNSITCSACGMGKITDISCYDYVLKHPADAARLMGYEVIEDSSSDSTTEIDETPTDTPTALDDTPTVSGDTPTEEDEMKCYRNGGCGPYEQLSCGECPASKPEYNSGENDGKTKHDKPRLAEALGVVEDEEWNFPGLIRTCRIHNGVRECFIEGEWKLCDNESILTHIINHPESIIRLPRLTEQEIAIMRAVGAKWVSLSRNAKNERVILWQDKPEMSKNGIFYGAISIAYLNTALFPSVKPGECIGLEEVER